MNNEALYLPMGALPVNLYFCFNAKQWEWVVTKLMGYTLGRVHPFMDMDNKGEGAANGLCTRFTADGNGVGCMHTIVISVDGQSDREPNQICGTICHEASHALDYIIEAMNEDEPGSEFKAYTIQWIAQAGILWYGEQRT
jgi:hypothetical protein